MKRQAALARPAFLLALHRVGGFGVGGGAVCGFVVVVPVVVPVVPAAPVVPVPILVPVVAGCCTLFMNVCGFWLRALCTSG